MNPIPTETAASYRQAGLSCLPAVRAQKRPSVGAWRTWGGRLPTDIEITAWFSNRQDALCIVAGAVSGNLECIDFDNHGELFEPWMRMIDTALLGRLVIERSPSGGYHVVYRCEGSVDGNLKLARGIRDGKPATLIETRGEMRLLRSNQVGLSEAKSAKPTARPREGARTQAMLSPTSISAPARRRRYRENVLYFWSPCFAKKFLINCVATTQRKD